MTNDAVKLTFNVPLPKSKTKGKTEEARRKIFAAYRRAYKALHIVEPTGYTMYNGMMRIVAGTRVLEIAAQSRVEQITRMMQERFNTR